MASDDAWLSKSHSAKLPADVTIDSMITSVLRGTWLGFCIAAPVGPIGILVLKQALRSGRWAGLASGLGAALTDLIYGFLAVAGVRLVGEQGRVVGVTGGVVLLYLAWRSWRETPPLDSDEVEQSPLLAGTATTFLLTLSNPMTILSFAAMVASIGAGAPAHFVGGVFLGSMLWWTILSLAAGWLRGLIAIRGSVLSRVAAVTLLSFGLWAICRG